MCTSHGDLNAYTRGLQAFPATYRAGHDLVNDRYAAVDAYPGERCRLVVVSFWSAAKLALVSGERRKFG